MSLDLLDLLSVETPNVDTGVLSEVRSAWPMNASAVSHDDSDQRSDRVRLRQVLDALNSWDITTSGIEPSHVAVGSAQVVFHGAFNNSGQLKERMLSVEVESKDLIEQVQMALQASGWPAVVNRFEELMVSRTPIDQVELQWMELGFTSAIENMTPERAAQWIEACPQLKKPTALARAQGSQMEPDQLAPWTALSKDQEDSKPYYYFSARPHLIKEWIESGLSLEEAAQWLVIDDYYMINYDVVRLWIDAGWNAEESKAWLNLSNATGDPLRVKEWTDLGFTGKHAMRILKAEASSWEVRRLSRYGCSAAEVVAWLECGVSSSDEIARFAELGLSGRDVRRWDRASLRGGAENHLRASSIAPWLESGRSIDQAEDWLEMSWQFIDLELVEGWESKNLNAVDASAWVENGVCSSSEVAQWMAAHPNCSDPFLVGQLVEQHISPEQASLVLEKLS